MGLSSQLCSSTSLSSADCLQLPLSCEVCTRCSAPEEKFNGAQEREPSSEFLPKPAAPKASPTLRVVAIASNEIVGDPMDSRGRARGAIHDKPVGYQQWCSMMESATPLDLESSDDEVETHQETSQAKNELRLESKVSE